MSATTQNKYIIGLGDESQILTFSPAECSLTMYGGLQNLKVNNWSQATQVNDQIFITGGLNSSGKIISNETFLFRPNANEMTSLAAMNQYRYVHQSVFKDGRLYVLGGRHYGPDFESVLSHCEFYQDGEWKVIAPMQKRRSNFGVFIYQNRIHVMGGFDGRKHTKSIEVYDEEKNVWRKLKSKLPRGLAGMTLVSIEPHKLLIIGGITQQGPTGACTILNVRDFSIIASGAMIEARTLPQVIYEEGRLFAFGGAPKQIFCESYDFDSGCWFPMEITFAPELSQIVQNNLRGFAVSQQAVNVEFQPPSNFPPTNILGEEQALLIGNDEFPFLMTIPKSLDHHQLKLLPVPCSLQLQSYMGTCLIENDSHHKLIFMAGGIDCRITQISKKAHLVSVDLQNMLVRSKYIGKLAYHRYAASSIFKHPYIYMIGGRGYQNDVLSLHSTVERYNMEEEEWEQVSPLSEAKCSTTVSIINERIYVFGGYIGDSKISNRIECFIESTGEWQLLNVKLQIALEGLSSIAISQYEVLIIGGKGQDGSKKDVIKYTWQELEDNGETQGVKIGEMECSRSLPKVMITDCDQVFVFGGQFYDNPEIQFAELLNPEEQDFQLEDLSKHTLPDILEKMHFMVGGPDFLGMFSVVSH